MDLKNLKVGESVVTGKRGDTGDMIMRNAENF